MISAVVCAAFAADTAAVVPDTSIPKLTKPDLAKVMDENDTLHIKKHSALGSAALSLLMPGAGQLLCRKPVKGALFFVAEGISIGVTVNRLWFYNHNTIPDEDSANSLYSRMASTYQMHLSDSAKDTTAWKTWKADSLPLVNAAWANKAYQHVSTMDTRFTVQQAFAWCVGIHVFNVFDGLQSSGKFTDDRPRNPGVAAALSAIPLLGLGQVYNGSLSKTGLLLMGEGCLAYMAWNNQTLLKECEKQRTALLDTVRLYNKNHPAENKTAQDLGYQTTIDNWAGQHDQVFHRRNAYLWYLVLLYFYGVGDAAVDAHLHNFKAKMRLQPIAGPTASGRMQVGMNLAGDF